MVGIKEKWAYKLISDMYRMGINQLKLSMFLEQAKMSRQMTPTQRITKARQLIQTAREIPVPQSAGWELFSYTAKVKDTLRSANDLVKLINYSPSTPEPVKADARAVMAEIAEAQVEILKSSKNSGPSLTP